MSQTATSLSLLPAEQTIVTALQALAGVCDFATTHDGQGFNGVDAHFGHDLAEKSMSRRLTTRQLLAARKMLQKYRVQLAGFEIVLPANEEMQALIFEIEHPFEAWCCRVLPVVEKMAQMQGAEESLPIDLASARELTAKRGREAFAAWQETNDARWQATTSEQRTAWAKTYARAYFASFRAALPALAA